MLWDSTTQLLVSRRNDHPPRYPPVSRKREKPRQQTQRHSKKPLPVGRPYKNKLLYSYKTKRIITKHQQHFYNYSSSTIPRGTMKYQREKLRHVFPWSTKKRIRPLVGINNNRAPLTNLTTNAFAARGAAANPVVAARAVIVLPRSKTKTSTAPKKKGSKRQRIIHGEKPPGPTRKQKSKGNQTRNERGGNNTAASVSSITAAPGNSCISNNNKSHPSSNSNSNNKSPSGSITLSSTIPDDDLGNGRSWPPGWTKVIKKRLGGSTAGQKDRYWISPTTKTKLRSLKEVRRFLALLEECGGLEPEARRIMRLRSKSESPSKQSSSNREETKSLKLSKGKRYEDICTTQILCPLRARPKGFPFA